MERAPRSSIYILDVIFDTDAQVSYVESRIRGLKGVESPFDEIYPLAQNTIPLGPFEIDANTAASKIRQNGQHMRVVEILALTTPNHAISESHHILAIEGTDAKAAAVLNGDELNDRHDFEIRHLPDRFLYLDDLSVVAVVSSIPIFDFAHDSHHTRF
jgi:hypothetical protein